MPIERYVTEATKQLEIDRVNKRTANAEAAAVQRVGTVLEGELRCKACQKGTSGGYKLEGDDRCVVVEGYLKGSCASCHVNGQTPTCSFYKGKKDNEVEDSESEFQSSISILYLLFSIFYF